MIAMKTYHDWAFGLEKWAGSDTILHLNFGLAIWMFSALLFWRPLRDPWLLVPLVLAEGANEICDYVLQQGWSGADTIHDIVATLFWPVILCIVSALTAGRAAARAEDDPRR